MDLIGMEMRARRARAKFTVLTRSQGSWTQQEIDKLVNELMAVIHRHPQHPTLLLIREEFDRERIEQLLGKNDFEHQVLVGFDNPALPFAVPSI
jgi:phosphoglycerate-specific signal transduction histidine kinase